MLDLFTLCDNIMYKLGDITGLGYETACVIFNIYGEYLLVIGSIMLLLIPCKNIWKNSKVLSIIGVILVLCYITFITFMVYMDAGHLFGLPIHEQFRISVQDVLNEAKELGMSYQEANLQIFVYTPIFIIVLNLVLLIVALFLTKLINKWVYK